ncbi:baseplate J/gp47 family protein [Chromobacterium haemolyticum]|uniref:baseplate J/gp47 family protein n=1 Tax=Chromobacterium haemolyticum TaxID=394935 RepID=UPI000DEEF118|nr:baseplate J/gp47 family protein [Chromobacterium haemolyticum]
MAKPEFIARSSDQITQEMVADLEGRSGKTLYPAQPERLLIDFMAYRESLLREQVHDAALLNLVRYSRGAILDELAKDRGEDRLPAYAAGCTLEFRVPVAQKTDFVIPAGTVVSTGNGALSVAAIENVTLRAGQFAVTVKASATDAGTQGNGYIAGQINQLISILAARRAGSPSATPRRPTAAPRRKPTSVCSCGCFCRSTVTAWPGRPRPIACWPCVSIRR